MSASYWQRGGAKLGPLFLTWPFAVLNISDDEIELVVGFFVRYRIPRSELVALRERRGLPWRGIRIVSRQPDVPEELVFWSPDYPALERALDSLGLSIEPRDKVGFRR